MAIRKASKTLSPSEIAGDELKPSRDDSKDLELMAESYLLRAIPALAHSRIELLDAIPHEMAVFSRDYAARLLREYVKLHEAVTVIAGRYSCSSLYPNHCKNGKDKLQCPGCIARQALKRELNTQRWGNWL